MDYGESNMKKLLKSIILTIALSVAVTASLSASPGAINFNNVPQTDEFNEKLIAFMTAYPYLRYWANKTYEEQTQAAQILLDELNSIKKPNVDEQLLKLLVMRCLYNQDKCTSQEIENLYKSIVKKFPKCAEVHWLYGNYLSTTTYSKKALEEMEKYLEMTDGNINLYFLEDYAVTNMTCDRKLRAFYDIKRYASALKKKPEDFEVYKTLKKQIIESSPDKTYTYDQIWSAKLVKQEGDKNFYNFESSMIGTSIPVQGSWELKYTGYEDNQIVTALIKPDPVKFKGESIGFSMILFVSPKTTSVMDSLAGAEILKTEKKVYNGVEWTVYTYEDKSRYQDIRKGAKGYVYTATIEPTEVSGLNCETPLDLNLMLSQTNGNEQINYYKTKKTFTRLNIPLQYTIFVDSCNAIDKETEKFLDKFMSEAIFE